MEGVGLQGVRAPRQAIKGYQGEVLITDSVYYLPLLDADGNIQVVCAYGVDEIANVTRTRLPHVAREIFPAIRAYMPWMETGAGHVELLIGLDNRQWLPAHVEDSWNPDDDMGLMKSAFGYRFMITEGWGRDLFPPIIRKVGQQMVLRLLRKPRRFSWKNTEAGARVCHRCQRHRWQTLSCDYLFEFSKKFETVLMEYSGAGGKLIHEKNQKQKSRDTVPLKIGVSLGLGVLKKKMRGVPSTTCWRGRRADLRRPATTGCLLLGLRSTCSTNTNYTVKKR
jgi:hypothetical protein